MPSPSLFRLEALQHHQHKQLGSVSINIPVQIKLLAAMGGLLALSLLMFVARAEFSDHCLVKGFLNVVPHLARVYVMQPGVVDKCYVVEGDEVKLGDRLYRIQRFSVDKNALATQQEWQLLKQKQHLLHTELAEKRQEVNNLMTLFKQHFIAHSEVQTKQDQLMEVSNQLNQLAMELIRYRNTHMEIVRAPIAGRVSNLLVHQGERVQPSSLLLTILPQHAQLVAELLVPPALMRFIVPGKQISLRYDAYPYQHYGTAPAVIDYVSHIISLNRQEQQPLSIGKPYYKVIAKLSNPLVTDIIPQGMTFNAVIPGARKTLWWWLFEPLLLYPGTMYA